jgi:ubiquinone/menaquinone biosynthesis C-methylase UbiE
MSAHPKYIHAMGHRALTPLYDPFIRLVLRERILRERLIERLSLRAGSRLLDVGCGTGTLAILARQKYPHAEVIGIDGDPEIVDLAGRKAAAVGAKVKFRVALATELPFEDRSIDFVTNTFVMHHLPRADKARCFEECLRVLRPGGQIHVVDFGPPRSRVGRAWIAPLRRMAWLADNFDGRLPPMLTEAGFTHVRETDRIATAFGPAVFLCACSPAVVRSQARSI